jgi:hypothetical protein
MCVCRSSNWAANKKSCVIAHLCKQLSELSITTFLPFQDCAIFHLADIEMASRTLPKSIRSAFHTSRTRLAVSERPSACVFSRSHHRAAIPAITASQNRHRPQLQRSHLQKAPNHPLAPWRTIFIQTQTTPNADVSALERYGRPDAET